MFISIISCSAYQSSGRKQFESQSPGNIEQGSIGVQIQANECWTQPTSEPLWFIQKDSQYNIQLNEQDQLEVCIVNSNL